MNKINLIRGIVAIILIAAGTAKLFSVAELHASFSILGVPPWFGYFIGACEVLGGIGLFINPLASLAAICISIIMAGAVYFHVQYTPLYEAIMGVLIFMSCIYIAINKKAVLFKVQQHLLIILTSLKCTFRV